MAPADDFVMTVDSDYEADDAPPEPAKPSRSKSKSKGSGEGDEVALNPDFTFDPTGDVYADILGEASELNDLLTTRKRKRVAEDDDGSEEDAEDGWEDEAASEDGEDSDEDEDGDDDDDGSEQDDDMSDASDLDEGVEEEDYDSASGSEDETAADKARKAAFFAEPASNEPAADSFLSMNLSRPILKALTSLGFHTPTPIQSSTIPVALLGKDIVGNAVTGSGKTAAFVIPMLERLLYRDKSKHSAATRCIVLVPTRELAVQCFDVATKLAAHTDIRFCLAVGGLSLKAQEAALRARPDVVIATPGRLIDHLRNSPQFALDAVDILVLDEADRMLSDGFADELAEIVNACPRGRQTMLFSATMTDSVDELVKMSLNKPARLFVDAKRTTARSLVQEFVRVRKEEDRGGMLVALCKRTFKARAIIFFRSKKLAHQMRVAFALLNLNAGELHGDLTQEQRLRSLQQFRDGQVDFLMATDLASRGLDIKGVEVVINYDMPNQLALYLHRVGRTARAGARGRSVTLVGEADRKMLKAAIKHTATAQKDDTDKVDESVRHRVVPPDALTKWSAALADLKDEIARVLVEEKEEKAIRQAEMQIKKGENMMEHEKEIYSRPARTWFQSEKDKQKSAETSKQQYLVGASAASNKTAKATAAAAAKAAEKPKRDKFSGLSRRAKRRKLALEEDAADRASSNATGAAIRAAKKSQRPPKIGEPLPKLQIKDKDKRKKKVAKPGFESDLGARAGGKKSAAGGGAREGARAKRGDKIAGMGGKKGKGGTKKGKR
ncbi:DEAD-domain-containing protein [Exidia glandulosa HHB12029]|uniref:RNA helicase n=1 Tax=Exidia glandulosa HHB12029 TaxID=1314781 RepID=A0A166BMQ8_EXIGL|nr:DEAD-domain-containing protein [Exidia glandulosa HHB12029]